MNLTCDLCGAVLPESTNGGSVVCGICGMEYSTDRLNEKRATAQPAAPVYPTTPVEPARPVEPMYRVDPVPPTPVYPTQPMPQHNSAKGKKKGNGIWILMAILGILAFLDGFVGTGGLVFVFCCIIAVIALLINKPWEK